jgi:hypothetical protein
MPRDTSSEIRTRWHRQTRYCLGNQLCVDLQDEEQCYNGMSTDRYRLIPNLQPNSVVIENAPYNKVLWE